jgi:uncharacterized protein
LSELVELLAKRLVDRPEEVRVEVVEDEETVVVRLHVAAEDRGKVIGRQGRIVRALRTLVRAGAGRTRRRMVLEIAE